MLRSADNSNDNNKNQFYHKYVRNVSHINHNFLSCSIGKPGAESNIFRQRLFMTLSLLATPFYHKESKSPTMDMSQFNSKYFTIYQTIIFNPISNNGRV